MKKLTIFLALILLLSACLCACTDKPEQNQPSDQLAPTVPKIDTPSEAAAPVQTGEQHENVPSDPGVTEYVPSDPGVNPPPGTAEDNPGDETVQPEQTGSTPAETETEDPEVQDNVEVTANGGFFFGGG